MIPVILDLVYLSIIIILSPIILYRVVVLGKYWQSLSERLGKIAHAPSGEPCIWLHGVSVGEIKAARSLVALLHQQLPQHKVVISATSAAGRKLAAEIYSNCRVIAFPLDFSWVVRRYLRYFHPELIILMELELWPNFLMTAARLDIPVILVNGRLSAKSFRGYRYLRPLFVSLTRAIRLFAMQAELYAERLAGLGIAHDRIVVTGNMKFDTSASQKLLEKRPALCQALGITESMKIWICGSTHAPEEKILLAVYRKILPSFPELRLLLVPRHPERAGTIAGWACDIGLTPVKKSAVLPNFTWSADQVMIGDRMGELADLYTISYIAFVGGSLIRHGGQNFIEPASLGKAVICGPFMHNFPELQIFLAQKSLIQLDSLEELSTVVTNLLANPDRVRELGDKAQALVYQSRGCSERNLKLCLQAWTAARKPKPAEISNLQ